MAPPPPQNNQIRSVWAHNLDSEFALIRSLIDTHPLISMDTEFPGVVFRPPQHHHHNNLSPSQRYHLLKANVDALHPIQLGLTLSSPSPSLSLPSLTFEFNFQDFDPLLHPHSPDSISLLISHGTDFERNREHGILTSDFAELMISSGLVLNDSVSWITFHSAYDFGYLIKMLTAARLPETAGEFMELVRVLFGERVYDVKYLMGFCGLHGGLERAAKVLEVERIGRSHQAGSDSLLTWKAFQRLRERFFLRDQERIYAGVLYGLESTALVAC